MNNWNDINNCNPLEDMKNAVEMGGGKVIYHADGKINMEQTLLSGGPMAKKLNYYYVCDCRCCKTRVYVTCSKQVYDRHKKGAGDHHGIDLLFDKLFHSCMGGIGVIEVVQIIETADELPTMDV